MRSSVVRRSKRPETRPEIQFIPLSTDDGKIRFFGTLMPALLLLKESPRAFLAFQIRRHLTPRREVTDFIAREGADDAARLGDTLIFVHRWRTLSFDPLAFARARTFLAQLTRLVRREGYRARAPWTRFRPTSTCHAWPRRVAWATSAPTACWCTPSSGRA